MATRPRKKSDDIFIRLDTIHEWDRRTDRHRVWGSFYNKFTVIIIIIIIIIDDGNYCACA